MNHRLPAALLLVTLSALLGRATATPALAYKAGTLSLLDGRASVNTGPDLRYLDAADARTVLVDLWGNPPQAAEDVLGMILPARVAPDAAGSWGVVVTQSEDGHVSDEDARDIDYGRMLRDMQAQTRETNGEREAAGYDTVDLIGWADAPRYDAGTHKLYWAKELAFHEQGGAAPGEHTLNYAVRVLGRDRVLELNAVAGMSQLPQVRADMQGVLARVSFTPGNRYEDFDANTDRLAGYGVAALVGGVAAKKLGLLAVLAVFFKKGWVLLLAVLGGLGRLFRRGERG